MKKTTFALLSILCSSSVFAELKVDNGYVRAVPPGQMMSAAFMQLTNTGDKTVELVGGKSSDVKAIEVHNHKKVDGVMKMSRVPALVIEPGQSVTLKPGGLHIMFIGLKKMIKAGDQFAFDLSFKDGSTQSLQLPIKSIIK